MSAQCVDRTISPEPHAVLLRVLGDATGGVVFVRVNDTDCSNSFPCAGHDLTFWWSVTPRRRWLGRRQIGAIEAIAKALEARRQLIERDEEAQELANGAAEIADELLGVAKEISGIA